MFELDNLIGRDSYLSEGAIQGLLLIQSLLRVKAVRGNKSVSQSGR